MNTISVLGNLGGDPELTYFDNGDCKSSFNMADSRKVKGQEETSWFRVIAFGKLAETIGKFLKKGRQVYVVGRMQQRSYTTKDGNDKTIYELVASQVEFVGPKPADTGDDLPE